RLYLPLYKAGLGIGKQVGEEMSKLKLSIAELFRLLKKAGINSMNSQALQSPQYKLCLVYHAVTKSEYLQRKTHEYG
ncbi:MAG: hypothetical protein ABI760_24050, partial [Ferruginibacter sp.]